MAAWSLAAVLAPLTALGHAFDPSLLELKPQELTPSELEPPESLVEVRWSTPVARATPLDPVIPCDEVEGSHGESVSDDRRTWIRTWTVDCGDAGLAGKTVRVDGLDPRTGEVLLRWVDDHGRVGQAVLDAASPSKRIPETPTGSVAGDYAFLGIEHILFGFDHLAFVLGLMLLVDGRRKLVWTLTAFTVGHSLTLAAAVPDLVTPPTLWIETAIAISILVLAVELAHRLRKPEHQSLEHQSLQHQSLLTRRPWLVAGAFGLLHGCGFAGALRDLGLPKGDVPLALLSFNVGIELGQLLFVAVLWLAWVLVRRVAGRLASDAAHRSFATRLQWAAAYVLGTLASYWTLDRLSGLF